MTKCGLVWILVLLGSAGCSKDVVLFDREAGVADLGSEDMGPADMAEADGGEEVEQWRRQHFIKASPSEINAGFGVALAVREDELLIGSPGSGRCRPGDGFHACNNRGAVFGLVQPSSGTGEFRDILPPEADDGSAFGVSIAANTDWVVVGASRLPIDSGRQLGGVFVFDRAGNVQILRAAEARLTPQFGDKVAISESWIAVLEPGRNCPDSLPCKSHAIVHVFRHDGIAWRLHQEILPDAQGVPAPETSFPRFGNIAIDERRLVVGLPYDEACKSRGNTLEPCPAAGSVRIFELDDDDQFQPTDILVRPDAHPGQGNHFGSFVVLDDRRLFVGAPGQAAVHEFYEEEGQWLAVSIINQKPLSKFGASIALRGDRILVGAPSERNCVTGVAPTVEIISSSCLAGDRGPGAVFVFDKIGEEWVEEVYIKPETLRPTTQFGDAVAFWGDTLVVSSPGDTSIGSGINDMEDREGRSGSGAVSTYVRGKQ